MKRSLKSSFTFFIVTGVLLAACSEANEMPSSGANSMKTPQEEHGNDSLVDIDTNQVIAWNDMRTDAESIQNCMKALTNHFSIVRPDSTVDSIYVYIGYDAENKTVSLFPIASSDDVKGNLKCLPISTLTQGEMEELPVTVAKDTTRPDAITLADAKLRIGRWMDSTTRDSWIAALCDRSNEYAMGQIFVIKSIDMVPGDKHECYIALREDDLAVGGYRGDLVVVNTRTHEILQPAPINQADLNGVVEDVVKLGPPFKRINMTNFGLLTTLRIK